ncbi:hypothetical protein SALBM135S_09594 [Streptomyces alboniger]
MKPTAVRAPIVPDAEKAAVLLDGVTTRGRALAELRREGEQDSTVELQARVSVRQAVRDAWAEGIEHTVQLQVLAEAGLADDASLAAAGWDPVLLAAIDRGQGWGHPPKAAAPCEPVRTHSQQRRPGGLVPGKGGAAPTFWHGTPPVTSGG